MELTPSTPTNQPITPYFEEISLPESLHPGDNFIELKQNIKIAQIAIATIRYLQIHNVLRKSQTFEQFEDELATLNLGFDALEDVNKQRLFSVMRRTICLKLFKANPSKNTDEIVRVFIYLIKGFEEKVQKIVEDHIAGIFE